VDVTKSYHYSKETGISFFVLYLHACMKAINKVENLKYRIQDDKVAIHDAIHASATISREDTTFGFSFIHFSEDFDVFHENFQKEKERIQNSTDLFPPINTEDCIYCSALPWLSFSGHKEPVSGFSESVPKLAFGKFLEKEGKLMMPVSIIVNHALVDGYHVGDFFKKYQIELNKIG
jgi:chloramphenicol O-acetyltransferase type A